MLFVGTSIIHPSTEGVFLLCNILDLLIYRYIIFFVLCEQEKVPLIPFLICMTIKKSSAHAKLFVKNLSCTLFLCFFLVKLLLSRVCFLVNITDFVDTKMEIHLCRRNIGMSHHLLDAL